ncbi:MAG: 5'-methylthioadenosine/adenosylhomocysteine nucleosidase [Oscillospiraceae bacterium]|nr:5'-methylthioadenosine/adenosylhomocysteine nucleosidase [Oscillospiraceae bacterium]
MIYGIMGAMPEEIRLMSSELTDTVTRRVADVDFITGSYAGHTVTLCCAGMGKTNAAAATQILISVFGAERIVFSGIAGNCSPLLRVGDVAVGSELIHHDIDNLTLENTGLKAELYRADPALVAAAEAACAAQGVHAVTGRIATGEQFICESSVKNAIIERCSPLCVEMEGAAVAQVSVKNSVPFVVVRAMSDDADEAAFEKLVVRQFDISEYCNTAAAIVLDIIRSA